MDWTFFATFTTPYEMTLPSARRLADRVHSMWGRMADGQCRILWVAERNELRDGHHLHALVWMPEHFRQPHLHAALCEAYSVAAVGGKALSNDGGKVTYERRARIDLQRYDKRRNASGYLTKYMTKSRDLLDWDILLSK
jgi:hypothetical protein